MRHILVALIVLSITLVFLLREQKAQNKSLEMEVTRLSVQNSIFKEAVKERDERIAKDAERLAGFLNRAEAVTPVWADTTLPDDVFNLLQDTNYFNPSRVHGKK